MRGFLAIFLRLLLLACTLVFPAVFLWSFHASIAWIIVGSFVWWCFSLTIYTLVSRFKGSVRVNEDGTRLRTHAYPDRGLRTGYLDEDDFKVQDDPSQNGYRVDMVKVPQGIPPAPQPSARDAPPSLYTQDITSNSSWRTTV
ncbi:hypothetical protein BJ684DRAFT_19845 [Piptocephalis cylindrospora]|uniref:Uncharacterized protein n=1 Tax=Piptocephalis cylindrospora TaxID=1907219 RepID=A0A4P9Y3Z6_9FUNG|nr:hypothetical protein BJ684DRAFT_19845 [Piptocephalis cylindrospora]|eukprot:RKP13688.1 hypothetical protein BJ684DRAFT_19845 [Piptocephalis cylindrospora]